jgi:CRISPR-associated protein Cas5t
MNDRVAEQPADYRPAHPLRLWLRLRAPFAAYRPMQAGSLRATLPTMPYSAAWGLALNLAGIDARSDDPGHHGTHPLAPCLRLCLGRGADQPAISSEAGGHNRLFQHLHGYPVGRSSQRFQRGTHGAKYHIAPAHRELLTDLDVVVGIEEAGAPHAASGPPAVSDDDGGHHDQVSGDDPSAPIITGAPAAAPVIPRIVAALAGTAPWPRSGLPFAGDNNLLFDRIDALAAAPSAHWYDRAASAAAARPRTRLHVGIDRHDSSRTTTVEVAPRAEANADIPATAWVWTPHPPYRPPKKPFASGR